MDIYKFIKSLKLVKKNMLKIKQRKIPKKILIYGLDGSGKSTFAETYCKEKGLNPVCIDIDDTNFTQVPIVEFDRSSHLKVKKQILEFINDVKESEYDTVIIDGVSSLLNLLVSNGKGLNKYGDRTVALNQILNELARSKLNFLLVGQIDLEIAREEPSVAIVNINSIVNEKYYCYVEKGQYKQEVKKFRSIEEVENGIREKPQEPKAEVKVERVINTPKLEKKSEPVIPKSVRKIDSNEDIAKSILAENNNFEVEIKYNNLNLSNTNNTQYQKIQNKKNKKKDISLAINIKYLEDKNKEQYFKNNDFNNNQNRNTLNINNSINSSINYNLFSNNSNVNDTNLITSQTLKNENNISNNENKNNDEIIKLYKNFKLIDNNSTNVYSLRELKSVYPLNAETWNFFIKDETKEKPNIFQGEFGYNILILNINKEERIYCFFFLDENNDLRQGYILFYRTNLEKKMIEELKRMTPLEFFRKYNIKYDNEGLQLFNYYEVIIFNLEKTEKKNNTQEIKINHEEIMNSIKNNIEGIKQTIEAGRMTTVKISNKLELDDINKNDDLSLEFSSTIFEKKNPQNIKNKEKPKKKKTFNSVKINLQGKLGGFFPLKSKNKALPGIKGLKNVGATCYMNATLQCFSNIDTIRTELINKYESLKANNKRLSSALAEVIYNLWVKLDERKYSPNNFKEVISKMNPMFKGIRTNDPKDLILFILMTIHKETNENNQLNFNSNEQPPDPSYFPAVYNDFINYSTSQNNSIISNEFYGYTNNMTMCGYCRKTIHNIQIVNILFFPLEEVRKFKGYYEGVRVPLVNCFEYYEKYEIYPSFYCNGCNGCFSAYSCSKLIKAPKSLIINLNRGRGLEFNVNVSFEEYLNIKQFICDTDSPYIYELKGVISHFGTNDDGGHFIAYCKNSNNCNWYKYNDEMVEECKFEDVLTKGMPYVLFYSHIELEADENELQDELYF